MTELTQDEQYRVRNAVLRAGGLARRSVPLCLTSAALVHRWEVKTVPGRPHILVARGRRIPPALLPLADWHRGDWTPDDVSAGIATSRGPGRPKMLRILAAADARADNPFESVLRSTCLSIPGVHVTPQRVITSVDPPVRPDLVDEELRMVIEADSFEWHGDRAALRRDARRYDLLVADRWVVLRSSWARRSRRSLPGGPPKCVYV